VPQNTASSLREQINRANEQSLAQKRVAAGQTAAGNNTENRSGMSVHNEQPMNRAVPRNPMPQNTMQQNAMQVRREQRPVQQTPVPAAQNRQQIQQNPAGMNRQMPKGTQNIRSGEYMQNRQNLHAVNGQPGISAERMHSSVQGERRQPAQNSRMAQNPEKSGQSGVSVSPAASGQSGSTLAKFREQAQHERAAVRKPQPQKPAERVGMSKTRVTDISSLTQSSSVRKKPNAGKKTPAKEKVVSDEGSNTVVSVVKAVIYMIFVVVVSVFLAVAIIMIGNDVFAFVKPDTAVNVTIPENATFDDITDILAQKKIITYPEVFRLYGKLKEEEGPYVAGDYVVTPMTSYGDLMDAFKPQPKSGTSRITIPEGYTTDEIIDLFVSYGIGTREGYEDVIQNYDFDYWFLDELEENGVSQDRIYRLDGYLFPDTYDFYNNSSEVTVLNKLLRRFDQLFTNEYREQCQIMGYSVDEIITLASLIEKEAGSAAEFFNVSSVFHNRLKNSAYYPRLESDATIVYAVQHETGERPRLVDTDYDTPYNTYLYKGLPPGPIANPSASAILAALSPAQTGYYFFVSDGSVTYFSETKTQHDQYIADIVAKNQ